MLWEKEFKGATYFNPDTAELISTGNGMITIYNSDGVIKYAKKFSDIVGARAKLVRELNDEELTVMPNYLNVQPWIFPSLFPRFSPKRNCFVELVLWPDKSVHFEMFRRGENIMEYKRLWSIDLKNVDFGYNSLLWGIIRPRISVSEKGFLGISGVSRIDKNSDQPPKERVEIYDEKGALIASFEEGKEFFLGTDIPATECFRPGFRVINGVIFSEDSKKILVSGRSKESYSTVKILFLDDAGKIIWEKKIRIYLCHLFLRLKFTTQNYLS